MLMVDTTTLKTSSPAKGVHSTDTLPVMIARASSALAAASSAAEILEAKEMAGFAYDVAKRETRLAKAKEAHGELIAAAFRAKADALEIEATANRRLADEYDSAQERGEVSKGRDGPGPGVQEGNAKVTAAEIGLTRRDIHEARQFRDAEVNDPGVTKRTLTELLDAGHEPTKARLREAVVHAAKLGSRFGKGAKPRNLHYRPNPIRDDLLTVWDCCKQITEVVERREVRDLVEACHDQGERNRLMTVIERGHGNLSRFVEEIMADA